MPHLLDRHRAERVSRQGRVRPAEARRAGRYHQGPPARPCSASSYRTATASARAWSSGCIAPACQCRAALEGDAAPAARRVWGGINGLLFHQMLHGVDIQPPTSRFSKIIGHQHVLEPELRTKKGAHDFAQHLLTKAAERLRRGDYYCRRLGGHLSWVGDLGGWWEETDFHETRDTGFLLARLEELWQRVPSYKPLSVGVVLLDLVPADHYQPDLFATDNNRRQKLSPLIDRIKDRYGRCSIGFGLFPSDVRAFKGHAAFHRVPEKWEF